MTGLTAQLALVAFLVAVNAAFAGSEMALVSLRDTQLSRLEERSATGALVARLARDPNRFLATIQVGITLAGFLASASAAVSLAEPVEPALSFLGGGARPGSVVVVTAVLAYVTLVLGELAPKRLAMQRAESWALVVARPLAAVSAAFRPVVWALSASTNLVVRALGGDPDNQRTDVTQEELRDLVAVHDTFTDTQRTIIDASFELADRPVVAVLQPRPDVYCIDAATPSDDALIDLAASGHSRAPVCVDRTLDTAVGIVHLRDLLDAGTTDAATAATPPVYLPETVGVLEALRTLQAARAQMAIVVNEHGGCEGIVTVEDLVEELVGEIYDESDRDVARVERVDEHTLVVPGRFPVHDLPDIGITVPPGAYTTVAGFILSQLGRIPETVGDHVELGDRRYTVTAVDHRAVTEVTVTRLPEAPTEGEPGAADPDQPAPSDDGGS